MPALSGLTVIALEQAVAAPFATRHLADMGARVIKVERPVTGDFARRYDNSVLGMSSHFAWLNRNKESLTVDLADPSGKEVLDRLLASADVFVYNLGPGAIERLGFPPAEVRRRFPRLVIAELTGYGSGGPYAGLKAYDLIVQAETGLISITGVEDAEAKAGIPVADIAAGTYLLQGALAALYARERSGDGAYVSLSLFDGLVEWMGFPMYHALYSHVEPPRLGMAHPSLVPYDAYPTADGSKLLIGVQNDAGWRQLAIHVLGRPDLVEDPDFATNIARCANRAAVDKIISDTTSRLNGEELIARLDAAGVANGRVRTMAELIDHPQLAARSRWSTVDSPVGPVRMLLPPLADSVASAAPKSIPALGADSAHVLASLGYSAAEVERLCTAWSAR
jgi:crotonobetainyl-CoA:carnitine CoA-transferase CaiB-like acyl-CoA transferase